MRSNLNRRNAKRRRQGLHLRGQRADVEVRGAFVRFCRWLRSRYEFPIFVPVYLCKSEMIRTYDGRIVSASFFAPDNPNQYPFIRIATGEFEKMRVERGQDNALASFRRMSASFFMQ